MPVIEPATSDRNLTPSSRGWPSPESTLAGTVELPQMVLLAKAMLGRKDPVKTKTATIVVIASRYCNGRPGSKAPSEVEFGMLVPPWRRSVFDIVFLSSTYLV